jgi:uncharacterized protein YndB with AHSA1/START domain
MRELEARMDAIEKSIEVARRPEDVFSYATDFSRFPEWQGGVPAARLESEAPLALGSRAVVTRRVGPRKLARIEELTELDPPRTWTVRGVGGPLTGIAKGAIEPLAGGERRMSFSTETAGERHPLRSNPYSAGKR